MSAVTTATRYEADRDVPYFVNNLLAAYSAAYVGGVNAGVAWCVAAGPNNVI